MLVQRSKIVLLDAEGVANAEIAERLGVARPTVIAWRKRYAGEGLTGGLADRHRRGRPQTVRRDRWAEILATTLTPPPQVLGVTQPVRPVAPGRVERRTHDDVRHGTTTLVAALEVATGQVTDACHPRHRHGELLDFLKLVARADPRRQLQVVLDSDATHKHAKVHAWLAGHPRVHLHLTPTDGSWLNLVEVFLAIIEHQALGRGDVASADELMAAIGRFCDGWNQRCHPFTWTKDADQILTQLRRQTTSTNH
jgi:hypothetical protein